METGIFAASSSTLHCFDRGPSSRKKPKIVDYEASEGSSSVEESDNNGLTVDSSDAVARNLVEIGFSSEQVAHAIKICGRNTPIELIFDFIQAGCLEEEVVEDDKKSSMVDKANTLIAMGCTSEQVLHAIEICGKRTQVDEIFDFIQATFFEKEVESLKFEEHVELTLFQELDKMGFSLSAIKKAMQTCESFDLETLVNLLLKDELPHEKESAQKLCDIVEALENEGAFEFPPFQELQKLGFSSTAIKVAMETCESLKREDLLSFLCKAGKGKFSTKEDLQRGQKSQPYVEALEYEGAFEFPPFQDLQEMGFSSSAKKVELETCESVKLEDLSFLCKARKEKFSNEENLQRGQKSQPCVDDFEDEEAVEITLANMGFSTYTIKQAMETCDTHDFEDLLNFLFEAEKEGLPFREDSKLEEICQKTWANEQWKQYGLKINNVNGPSKALISPVLWTRNKIKLWYAYVGFKQDFFTASDAFRSAKGMHLRQCKQSKTKKLSGTSVAEKMMGFSIPGFLIERPHALPGIMLGPPYFYFENVASAPKNEWETIKRHLHGVEVEFVDSKFFSACRRPRGYVHNIPVDARKLLIPEPPMSIFEAFPSTQQYWPHWDTREKLNCINTRRAPDTLSEMIQSFFTEHEGAEIPYVRQQEIVIACKRWNLVWVGPGQAAPLEPQELELLLGFDKDHTRGCSSMSSRYIALGNAFQVNTVAYHLSPLKQLYPDGITVLSLFSGIGGAEVALHKCGITLKAVVAVESDIKTRNVIASWWKKTGQRGVLRPMSDVRDLTYEVLSDLINDLGTIDLIIGGSPCSNLSGCNRVSRTGLSGKESSLFFEFSRILDLVKRIMMSKG